MNEPIMTYRGTVYSWQCDHIRLVHEMINQETQELVARTHLTGVGIDTTTRKARPLPPDVAGHRMNRELAKATD